MIKTDAQRSRTQSRITELQRQLAALETQSVGREFHFLALPLRDEIQELRAEIDEFTQLKTIGLQDAVAGPLSEPVLLEHIGALLAKLRIAAKLTQEQMAERLGWQQSNLSRFESDNYASQTIAKVSEHAGALGVWLYVVPEMSERPTAKYNLEGMRKTALFGQFLVEPPRQFTIYDYYDVRDIEHRIQIKWPNLETLEAAISGPQMLATNTASTWFTGSKLDRTEPGSDTSPIGWRRETAGVM